MEELGRIRGRFKTIIRIHCMKKEKKKQNLIMLTLFPLHTLIFLLFYETVPLCLCVRCDFLVKTPAFSSTLHFLQTWTFSTDFQANSEGPFHFPILLNIAASHDPSSWEYEPAVSLRTTSPWQGTGSTEVTSTESCHKPGCLISALQQSTTRGCDIVGYKCGQHCYPAKNYFK